MAERTSALLAELPDGVELVAAVKGRTAGEVAAAVGAGVRLLGANYVQDARSLQASLADTVPPVGARWHLIGHLQRNKAAQAVDLFDVVETVDSLRLALALERSLAIADRRMSVLIEVNIAREPAKSGVAPEDAADLARQIAALPHIAVEGLMTMGPPLDPPSLAPHFRAARALFEHIAALSIPGVAMRHLSMGMSDSFREAIAAGATRVRVGTLIFGPRPAR